MFKNILVPVDLAHKEKLKDALDCASDLAKLYDAQVTYVGVTSSVPNELAHNPDEFGQKLQAFAQTEALAHGIEAATHVEIAHDPRIQIEDSLMRAIDKVGAELVVMASHVPGALEYIWPSNGGKLAEHARCSVMLVRT